MTRKQRLKLILKYREKVLLNNGMRGLKKIRNELYQEKITEDQKDDIWEECMHFYFLVEEQRNGKK